MQKVQRFEDTAANWTTKDPILPAGWEGIESDTGKWKAGDGFTAWSALSYVGVSIGGVLAGGTQGSVLFVGAAGVLAQNNTAFFWDDTNRRLKLTGASGEIPLQIANSTVSNGLFLVGVDNAGGAYFQGHTGVNTFSFTNINGLVTPHTLNVSAAGGAISNLFKGYNATDIPVRIQLAAAQSADAFQVFASDGTTKLAAVDASGNLITATKTPASAAASGSTGTFAWDASFIYVCIAANTWKRIGIVTW